MATMLSLGIKVPVVSVSSRRHATRTVRASDKHHATDSSGSALSPPASGEKFVTVSSVLQQVVRCSSNGTPPPPLPARRAQLSQQ